MRIILILFLLLFSTSGFAAPAKLQVVTSFSILEDMARQLGGDKVEVKTLVGFGGDLHRFEPKPQDAAMLSRADLFVVNGLGLEGFAARLVQSSGFKGEVVEASKGVKPLKAAEEAHEEGGQEEHHHHHEHDHGAYDPHAWQSIKNARMYATNIATAYAAKDPANQQYYGERLTGYLQRLLEVEQLTEYLWRTKGKKGARFIVPHQSFAYLGAELGIEFVAPQGLSTEAEPTAADIAAMIDAVRAQQVAAIFSENIAPTPVIRQIAEEAGVAVGGTLYSDALTDAKGPAPSYLALYEANVAALIRAVQKP